MITVQRLLEELGNKAWSGFNKDDMIYSNEDAKTAITELNCAHRYLLGLEEFPFKANTKTITTVAKQADYDAPDGQIRFIKRQKDNVFLSLCEKPEELTEQSGTPNKFYFKYENPYTPKIVLHPTPTTDGDKYDVNYNTYKFILDKNGKELNEFNSADNLLNMPQHVEYLYMDALILRTIAQGNKDQTDENYQPTLNEFNEVWQNFLRNAQPVRKDTYILI